MKNKTLELELAHVYKLVKIDFADLKPGDIALMPENDVLPFVVKTKPVPSNVQEILVVETEKFKPGMK